MFSPQADPSWAATALVLDERRRALEEAPAMTEPQPSPEGDLHGPRDEARPAVERRRSPRRACRSAPALSYVPWPGELGQLGHALDVGPQGIGFLAARPLRPGSVLVLQVLCGAPGTSRMRVARVVHCAGGAEGRWRVGCHVSPPFSPEEVASLA